MDPREKQTDKSGLIHDLRFGYTNIRSLTDEGIINLLGYYLPYGVAGLCLGEMNRRRGVNLCLRADKSSPSLCISG